MKSLNRIEVIGRVGQDPKIRQAGGSSVAEFSVATSEKWSGGERTDWHRISAWGKLADIVEQYVRKGDLVFIAGSMKYEKYTDKNGVEKEVAKVNARDLLMLGGNKQSAQSTKRAVALDEPDDDLPF